MIRLYGMIWLIFVNFSFIASLLIYIHFLITAISGKKVFLKLKLGIGRIMPVVRSALITVY